MSKLSTASRRQWMQQTLALGALGGIGGMTHVLAQNSHAAAEKPASRRWLKTLKVGMVRVEGSWSDKFKAVKAAGFDGIELDAPGFNVDEIRKAIDDSGLPVDGSVCSSHWQVRHTDPDPEVRAKALATLKEAVKTTKAVGGHTVLLVLGHGKDGEESVIWKRAMDNLKQVLPLCADLGVYIAIENVWNEFLYDHQGGPNQTAEKFAKFVDEANSPWVGMQFDIGNHWKYGNPGDWIRTLGKRVVKLDIKGFSRQENKFTKFAAIGDDDLPWNDVRQALIDINYSGWVAAEVGGGGPDRLKEIAEHMDRVLPQP